MEAGGESNFTVEKPDNHYHSMVNRWGKVERVTDFIVLGFKTTADGDCSHKIKRRLPLGRKAMTKLDSFKEQRYHFANKGPYSQSCGFPSRHTQMCKLDHKEAWVPKNWCFQRLFESLVDCQEIKPVNPKGTQPWIFIGMTDAKAEAPIFWPPDAKSWLIGKDFDAGKDRGQEEKRVTEDEMVGWHYRLNGHEFEQTPGDSEGQGSLMCCSLQDCKESDTLSYWTTVTSAQ